MMRAAQILIAIVLGAGCGGGEKKQPEPVRNEAPPPETRTQLQARQEAACEQVGPRVTQCAVADAKAKMKPDEVAKLDLEKTAPIHTREFIKQCTSGYMSSRQVRVYEVCLREETECDPFLACLDNAKPQK